MQLTIQEILSETGGKCLNNQEYGNTIIENIFTDSRQKVNKGLFIPLMGEKFDGHDYINQVYSMGAIATLTAKQEVIDNRLITIYVEDTREALLSLAKYYNKKFIRPIIAITGSVGKTTTKEMVTSVLETAFKVHKTVGNFNNDIGVPKTIFSLSPDDQVSVIEMGMNHFGEISQLSKTVNPDFAVITNIGTAHIENLGSREGILKAKLEILDGLKPNGKVIINGDEPLLFDIKQDNWITVGLHPKVDFNASLDYFATNIVSYNKMTKAIVYTPTSEFLIKIPAPGKHMVRNALVAICIAEQLGISTENIIKGIANYQPEKMRMQIIKANEMTIIDDTYNASYDSMAAAIDVLELYLPRNNRVAILGDIFELGDFSEQIHRNIGEYIADHTIDCLYTIGNFARYINEAVTTSTNRIYTKHFDNKEIFIKELNTHIKPGDTILVKASRGMNFEEIVGAMRKEK